MIKFIWVTIFLLEWCLTRVFLFAPDGKLGEEIQKYIQKFQWVPGVGAAVVVIRGGKVIHLGTYGYSDRATKKSVSADTLFAIGSTAKSFGAFSTLLGAQAGLLKMDSPVRQYMPEFELSDQATSAKVTAVDLLSHRIGLAPFDSLWLLTPFSREQLVEKIRYLPLSYAFREQFQYNNLAILAAAHLVERVSGRSWEDFTRDQVFKALEMNSSVFTTQEMLASPDHATGYLQEKALSLTPVETVGPAGSIYSSIQDMSHWLYMLIEKGRTSRGDVLLKTNFFDQLLEENTPMIETEAWKISYGLGWQIVRHKLIGARLIQHTGGAAGFSSYVGFRPDSGFKDGVVVLTNQHGTEMAQRLSDQIFLYLSEPHGKNFDLPAKSEPIVPFHPVITISMDQKPRPSWPPLNRASLPGTYWHPAFGPIKIELTPEGFPIAVFYGKKWPLFSVNGREFYFVTDLWKDEPYTFEMAFYPDCTGAIGSLGIPFDFGFAENQFKIRAPVKFKRVGP